MSLCDKELTIATNSYWGCDVGCFFVELENNMVSRIDFYIQSYINIEESFTMYVYPNRNTATIKKVDIPKITISITNERFLYSLLTKELPTRYEKIALLA